MRIKVIAILLIGGLLAAWTHGAFLPASNTALVQDASANFVVDSSANFLQVNDRTIAGATYKLVCNGDSITTTWVAPPGYCSDVVVSLLATRSITATWKAVGMSGYSWEYSYPLGPWFGQTIDSEAPSQVDTEIYPGLTNILVGEAGTNGMFVSLGNNSAATEFINFQIWYNARITAGWAAANIIVVTVIPRQDDASFDTKRATYNASVISFCASNGCKVADAGGDANIGCNGCEDNTACFLSDKIHLSASGTCGGVTGGGMNYLATQLILPKVS